MIKRTIDIIGAALCLLVLTPVIGVVALLINRQLGSPIFFSQIRPGLDGQPFRMFKFRTMTDARDENGELLPDVQRLPPFGVWLRATSMDELPELWNVIRGDMSLVGPGSSSRVSARHYWLGSS
jgi:sugar transferase EpsL